MNAENKYRIIQYEDKYRDDLIFMILEAKDALGRVPGLNNDLLDIDSNYINKGDMFWIALNEKDRVIGSVGYNTNKNKKDVTLHRLFVKYNLKHQGIGTKLLYEVENYIQTKGIENIYLNLGIGDEWYESRMFYKKHGYMEYEPNKMKKTISLRSKQEEIIGLKRGTVRLVPYMTEWQNEASKAINMLKNILKDDAVGIEHVGSTAIKDISSKPIIDIVVGVKNFYDIIKHNDELRENAVVYRGSDNENQLLYVMGDFSKDTRTHHIHVVIWNDKEWNDYIRFRDFLNNNKEYARAYEDKKLELAKIYADNRGEYTLKKNDMINEILSKARERNKKNILFFIFDGITDYEITFAMHMLKQDAGYNVVTMSYEGKMIQGKSGLRYKPDITIDEVNEKNYDAIIIGGGWYGVVTKQMYQLLTNMNKQGKLIAGICGAGTFFLAKTDVLKDVKYTTPIVEWTKEHKERFESDNPFLMSNYVESKVVRDKNIITAIGPAFIEFAIEICDWFGLFEDEEDKERFSKIYNNGKVGVYDEEKEELIKG